MKLRSLKYFRAVYEQGSISGAARHCFISQPSITAAIAQLEQELEISLFVRHAGGVRATAAADKLYPLAREMSDNEKSILGLFRQGPRPVPLRLGLMRSLGAQRMSLLLTELSNRIEHLELTLVDPDEPCDARIILSQAVRSTEVFIPIWQDNYQIALPKAWAMAAKPAIAIEELHDIPFINRTPCDAMDRLQQALAMARVQYQPRANIRTIEYAWPMVSAGVGAALLPDWQEIRDAQGLELRPIQGLALLKRIGLAFNAGRRQEAKIAAVLSVCETRANAA